MSSSDAHEHIDHCDVLITGCLQTVETGRALGCHVAIDEDLTPLDLLAMSETLGMLAIRIGELARDKAQAN
jgi:hypothetical protein